MRALVGALVILGGALATTGFAPVAAATARPLAPDPMINPRLQHRATFSGKRAALAARSTTTAAPVSTANASGLSTCSNWSQVPSANDVNHNVLGAVAAISANDVWSVGWHTDAFDVHQTLTEHWDGSGWNVVDSHGPNTGDNVLTSVGATTSNDAWAVGADRGGTSGPYNTLAERWNGNGWNVSVTPNPATGSNVLFGVKGDTTNDYWAVGRSYNGTSMATLAEHWDGTGWSIVATPSPSTYNELIAVAVLASNNVWAVGDSSSDNVTFQTLIEHYDGTSWTVSPSPQSSYNNGVLFGVAGTASDLYAVGAGQAPSFDITLIEHWNGTSWTTVANVPTGGDTDLNSVTYSAANDVWAVGTTFGGTQQAPANSPFKVHWDGNSWNGPSPLPTTGGAGPAPNGDSGELIDVAQVSGSDVWAVGDYRNSSGMLQTLTLNFCRPPTITTINPTSGPATGGTSVTINGTGLVWTTGVNFGTTPGSNVAVISDTQATVMTNPGRAGTVDTRVDYFAGQSAISAGDQFTYIATTPTAPQNVAAVARDSSAIVYWQAPASDGGATITTYTVTPYIAAVAQTPTTVNGSPPPTSTNITGLTNGVTYTFKVSATNSVGQGPDSAPSNAVTPSATAIASGPEASSWGKGRLDLFIKGADGALWHKFYDSSLGWSGWSSLGAPTGVTLASDPVAISWGYARIDIFVRGSDNALWHKYYDVNLGGWSAWYSHGGTLTSGPTATSWGYGRLDVFYRGSDNTLRHIFYASFIGAWSAEYNHGGVLASDPSAVSWGVGRIDVVARGNDGSLQHNDYDQTRGGWLANWESIPGNGMQGGPTITTWGLGRLDVFARGLDNALQHTYFLNTGWAGWSEHGNPAGNVLISDPGAIAWSSGRIDIWARGDNNQLLHKFYDANYGGWSDWFTESLSPTPG